MPFPSIRRTLSWLLISFFVAIPVAHAAVDNVSKIVVRTTLNTTSNPLQIAEVRAVQAGTGVDRATAAQGALVTSTGTYDGAR